MDYRALQLIISKLKSGDSTALDSLPEESRKIVELILGELQSTGKSLILEALWEEDFKRKPVTIDQFLDDDYYLGKVGRNVFPYWRTELRKVHDPSRDIGEWILRGCFPGFQKVKLLNGTSRRLDSLIGDEEFYVYSYDSKSRDIVVGKGKGARLTGRNIPCVKVTLDSGKEIVCTGDHPFLLLDGTYAPASSLTRGTSLMPLYLSEDSYGHYRYMNPHTKKWRQVHDFVAEYKFGRHFREDLKLDRYLVVHHEDDNPKNNHPDNIDVMDWLEHRTEHASRWADSHPEEVAERMRRNSNKFWSDPKNRERRSKMMTKRNLEGLSQIALESFWTPERREHKARETIEYNKLYHPRLRQDITFDAICEAFIELGEVTFGEVADYLSCSRCRLYTVARSAGFTLREIRELCVSGNHKVVSVEYAGDYDVFNFEVDRYNNYALDEGVFVHNSIGAGKTFVAVISILYKIHYILCMKNPQTYYNLAERSPIVFGLFNIFKYLARDTSYQYLSEWVKLSRFFIEEKRRSLDTGCNCWRCRMQRQHAGHDDALQSGYISFPHHITIALGSSAIHALGQNIMGGLLDEADMGKNKSITDEDISQVADMYAQVRSRMDSRFLQRGGSNPGLLCLVSQVRSKSSFLEEHVKKRAASPLTHISQFALWDVKSVKEKSGDREYWINLFEGEETFKVVVGNQRVRSFIPENDSQIKPGMEVIDVPISLKDRFEYNLDSAIRDLAGIATYGVDLFLPRRDKLFDCYTAAIPREHPFTVDTVELSIDEDISIVDYFNKSACMYQHDKITGAWRPKWHNGVDRAIHIDLSINRDATGLAMGCIGDVKEVVRFDEHERPYTARDYTIFIDFVLRIKAVKGSEIDFSRIRQFIYYLHAIGYPIRWVSLDGFQSVDTIQQLKKAGYDAKVLSVDKKPLPYHYLRSTIMEVRLDIYEYQPFTTEITQLQDRTLQKLKPAINHPPKKSKDASDAVCGVATRLQEERMSLTSQTKDESLQERIGAIKPPTAEQRLVDNSWVTRDKQSITNPLAAIFNKYKS